MTQPPFIMHRLGKKPLVGVEENNAASAVVVAMYVSGELPALYPVPAPLWVSDTAIGWTMLQCPHKDGPCNVCIENYEDQITDDLFISLQSGD